MKCGMTIEYLKCRADLNYEVDFGVNGAIGTIVTKWDLFYVGNGLFSSTNFFLNTHHMPLISSDSVVCKKEVKNQNEDTI